MRRFKTSVHSTLYIQSVIMADLDIIIMTNNVTNLMIIKNCKKLFVLGIWRITSRVPAIGVSVLPYRHHTSRS